VNRARVINHGGWTKFMRAVKVIRFARRHSTMVLVTAAMYLMIGPALIIAVLISLADSNVVAGVWAFVLVEVFTGAAVLLLRSLR
jgi:hypothetical protein